MNIAIDSLPLKFSLSQSTDYSGIQFYSLCDKTLADTEIRKVEPLVYECRLPGSLTWEHGSRITGHDFLVGFKTLFHEKPYLKKILFKDLRTMECDQNRIRFFIKKPNRFFTDILKRPFITPGGDQARGKSGEYFFIGRKEKTFQFKRKYNSSGPEEILIHHILSPEENFQSFNRGEIDITADTALPLHLNFESLPTHRSDTGLYGGFEASHAFIKNTSLEMRKQLTQVISRISFYDIHFNRYDAWTLPKTEFKIRTPLSLTIAYDPFYPNLEICENVKLHLENEGYKVALVEDNYYQPHQNFDMKYVIRRGYGVHSYFRYLSLINDPGLREENFLLKSFAKVFAAWENGGIDDTRANLLCDHLLAEAASFIPLFKIPSLYLSQTQAENPLLKYLK